MAVTVLIGQQRYAQCRGSDIMNAIKIPRHCIPRIISDIMNDLYAVIVDLKFCELKLCSALVLLCGVKYDVTPPLPYSVLLCTSSALRCQV
jgi:hypothetical protein